MVPPLLSPAATQPVCSSLHCEECSGDHSWLSCCVGTTHRSLLALRRSARRRRFLRSAASEGVPGRISLPASHLSPDRWWLLSLYSVRSTRVRLAFLCYRCYTSRRPKCQPEPYHHPPRPKGNPPGPPYPPIRQTNVAALPQAGRAIHLIPQHVGQPSPLCRKHIGQEASFPVAPDWSGNPRRLTDAKRMTDTRAPLSEHITLYQEPVVCSARAILL